MYVDIIFHIHTYIARGSLLLCAVRASGWKDARQRSQQQQQLLIAATAFAYWYSLILHQEQQQQEQFCHCCVVLLINGALFKFGWYHTYNSSNYSNCFMNSMHRYGGASAWGDAKAVHFSRV